MAKKSKTSKRAGRKSAPKAKASVKSKPKAKGKARRPKSKAKKNTSSPPKAKVTKTKAQPKAKKSASTKPKAKKSRKTVSKKSTPKKSASKKTVSRKRVSRKAKSRKSSPKAKASRKHRRVKASTKSKSVSKPKSRRRKARTVSKKRRTVKSKRTHKTKSAGKKRHIAKRSRPAKRHARHSQPKGKGKSGDFDFNAWLLPEMELEKHDPTLQIESGVEDNVKGSTRYGWIGSGQCGGRLVKSFYDIGYKKVLAVNTTHNDLDTLELPKNQKFLMDIGEKGAGKDTNRGQKAAQEYKSEILHHINKIFGSQVDHIMVCFGAGGGTGSGSAIELLDVAKRYARYVGLNPDKNVGVLMTLPTIGESSSPIVAKNAYDIVKQLSQMAAQVKISPFIIIDNDKVQKMYPGLTVKSFWPSVNQTVAGLFDIFNRLSAMSSPYTAFDPSDYRSIMQSGGCTIMGLTKVNEFKDKFAISQAVKKNLEKTLLASGFELSSAQMAGCIVVGSKKLMSNVSGLQDNINYAFDVLSEITGQASVHRGIYEDNRDYLRVYTVIGGLDAPLSRLQEMVKKPAGVKSR